MSTPKPRTQFALQSRILHWLMAAMLLAMLFIGVTMVASLGDYHRLVAIHRPLGIVILILAAIRFANRMCTKLPPFPPAWMDDTHRVPGCQSRVWMQAEPRDGALFLAGASDAAIVSGLIALLLRVYSGRSPEEIIATDPAFLKELGLMGALSTNRGNGVAAMVRKIRELAATAPAVPRMNGVSTRLAVFSSRLIQPRTLYL